MQFGASGQLVPVPTGGAPARDKLLKGRGLDPELEPGVLWHTLEPQTFLAGDPPPPPPPPPLPPPIHLEDGEWRDKHD